MQHIKNTYFRDGRQINTISLRERLGYYQALNETEWCDCLKNAGQKSLAQKWQEFCSLIEFGYAIKPQPSLHEQRQKIEMLGQYYARIQQFEAWRQQHGKSS